jgi:hypothetical protein
MVTDGRNLALWVLALAVAAAAGLWRVRSGQAQRLARASWLDEARALFENPRMVLGPSGFPRLDGTYRGQAFDIQLIDDGLNLRKLPTLWLMVSLVERLPLAATVDVMMRPRGIEFFSRFQQLPVQLAPEAWWPHDCSVRCDERPDPATAAAIQAHADVFDDALAKELVVSPKGLRLVWLAAEANRGKYLIFRDNDFGSTQIAASQLRPLLDRLIDLRHDLLQLRTSP